MQSLCNTGRSLWGTCFDLGKLNLMKQNRNIFLLCWHALSCSSEEFFVLSFLFRQRVSRHNFLFQQLIQLVVKAFKHLIQRTRVTNIYRLVWSHTAAIVFPVILPSTFPQKIQTHILLHVQHPLHSRNCNRLSLPPKRL